ncbi:CDP-diacylglycerol-serine O-phosphatidyltransferase [Knufia obscura]|uniref:CDP-diacylglycerol--serine O-phosphatidyltransferase n=2 Tax=Knufia TaxID=430999 RepID=A0AAN8I3Q6_9EURO|nr:CDP-diacylglycerol-serine O-phosphatidyltransferase [Knufia obscura]KAK5953027.1 CDP-diacylglycerol-serine O-phosphatidyltransferase [Knufia fluminis]
MSQRKGATTAGHAETEVKPQGQAQNKQAILLAQDAGHFSLIKAMHLADVITEMNGFCGFMSVLSAMRYCLGDRTDTGNLWAAFFFMPFGLFFDLFDGKVARWRQKSSLMGQELDSLADLISFGVAPASVGFAIGLQTFTDQILLSFYVLCGLTRLARFNVTVAMLPKDKTGKSKYFEGTPIPFACLTSSAIMATLTFMDMIHGNLPLGTALTGTALEFHPLAVLFIINGVLMTSRSIHVPKP